MKTLISLLWSCCWGNLNSVGGNRAENVTQYRISPINDQINVFRSNNCSFQFFAANMAKTKQFLLPLSAFYGCLCGNKEGKSSNVNWGKKRKKEKLSRFAKKIRRAERELPFCGLVEGREKKTQLGLAAVTSLDPQFVSDPCALLIEISNLGVL